MMLTGTGDIAFVGFNADGNDDLAFVTFVNIGVGETIYFTDNEWDGAAFNAGESYTVWTATQAVTAGTVITLSNFTGGATASIGTLAPVTVVGSTNRGVDGLRLSRLLRHHADRLSERHLQ